MIAIISTITADALFAVGSERYDTIYIGDYIGDSHITSHKFVVAGLCSCLRAPGFFMILSGKLEFPKQAWKPATTDGVIAIQWCHPHEIMRF